MVSKRYIIHGMVQGVGFRYFVYRAARQLELTGWVRNNPSGTVEILASGKSEPLEKLEELLQRGPTASRVDRMEVMETGEEPGGPFTIGGW